MMMSAVVMTVRSIGRSDISTRFSLRLAELSAR
jgi:hypothetical protein